MQRRPGYLTQAELDVTKSGRILRCIGEGIEGRLPRFSKPHQNRAGPMRKIRKTAGGLASARCFVSTARFLHVRNQRTGNLTQRALRSPRVRCDTIFASNAAMMYWTQTTRRFRILALLREERWRRGIWIRRSSVNTRIGKGTMRCSGAPFVRKFSSSVVKSTKERTVSMGTGNVPTAGSRLPKSLAAGSREIRLQSSGITESNRKQIPGCQLVKALDLFHR